MQKARERRDRDSGAIRHGRVAFFFSLSLSVSHPSFPDLFKFDSWVPLSAAVQVRRLRDSRPRPEPTAICLLLGLSRRTVSGSPSDLGSPLSVCVALGLLYLLGPGPRLAN